MAGWSACTRARGPVPAGIRPATTPALHKQGVPLAGPGPLPSATAAGGHSRRFGGPKWVSCGHPPGTPLPFGIKQMVALGPAHDEARAPLQQFPQPAAAGVAPVEDVPQTGAEGCQGLARQSGLKREAVQGVIPAAGVPAEEGYRRVGSQRPASRSPIHSKPGT